MSLLLVTNPSSGSGREELADLAEHTLDDVRVVPLKEGVDLGTEVEIAVSEGGTAIASGGTGRSTRWSST
jgi:hypothetical protein